MSAIPQSHRPKMPNDVFFIHSCDIVLFANAKRQSYMRNVGFEKRVIISALNINKHLQ